MPCTVEPTEELLSEANQTILNLTQLLCAMCRHAEASLSDMPADVRLWWEAHKAADQRRADAELKHAAAVREHELAVFYQLKRKLNL